MLALRSLVLSAAVLAAHCLTVEAASQVTARQWLAVAQAAYGSASDISLTEWQSYNGAMVIPNKPAAAVALLADAKMLLDDGEAFLAASGKALNEARNCLNRENYLACEFYAELCQIQADNAIDRYCQASAKIEAARRLLGQ